MIDPTYQRIPSNTNGVISENKYLWYLDSGCTRHMIGDKTKFAKLELKDDDL